MAQFLGESEFYIPNWDWTAIAGALAKNPAAAHSVFANFGVQIDLLFQLAIEPGPGESYGRRALFRSDKYEVMLAAWPPDAECAPHDHGFSRGLVWLAMGQFIENHYSFQGELRQTNSVLHRQASAVISVECGDIRSLRAPHGGISLHIFSPPIQRMKVYDWAQCRTLTVAEECGAWIPADGELILDEKPWRKPSELSR